VRVIPVLDLMQGQIVRGVGGRRETYRPIESRLCGDPRPESVGRAFVELGFRSAYLADLDAIQGHGKDSRPLYEELMGMGLELWVDAGLRDAESAGELARWTAGRHRLAGIVAGLESMAAPRTLFEICRAVDPGRLVFSLDMKQGRLLVGSAAWEGLSAEEIARMALRAGVRRMIVLDLAQVGRDAGVGTLPLCRRLRCIDPQLEIVAGGGVRSMRDLDALERAGCDAALVASALHDGRLPARECAARSRSGLTTTADRAFP
jgi:phosphoribosylformimino-5-aminoimidazole carboxamide ribotide isomerase